MNDHALRGFAGVLLLVLAFLLCQPAPFAEGQTAEATPGNGATADPVVGLQMGLNSLPLAERLRDVTRTPAKD